MSKMGIKCYKGSERGQLKSLAKEALQGLMGFERKSEDWRWDWIKGVDVHAQNFHLSSKKQEAESPSRLISNY